VTAYAAVRRDRYIETKCHNQNRPWKRGRLGELRRRRWSRADSKTVAGRSMLLSLRGFEFSSSAVGRATSASRRCCSRAASSSPSTRALSEPGAATHETSSGSNGPTVISEQVYLPYFAPG